MRSGCGDRSADTDAADATATALGFVDDSENCVQGDELAEREQQQQGGGGDVRQMQMRGRGRDRGKSESEPKHVG